MSIWYGYGGDGRAYLYLKESSMEHAIERGGPTPLPGCRRARCPPVKCVCVSSARLYASVRCANIALLTLYVSKSETVGLGILKTLLIDPDVLVDNPVAISTRVAPSFARWSARVICPPHSQQCSSKSIRRVEHDSVTIDRAKATLIKALVLPIN